MIFTPTLHIVKGIYDIAGANTMILPTVYSPFQMLVQTVGANRCNSLCPKGPERIKQALGYFTDALIGICESV